MSQFSTVDQINCHSATLSEVSFSRLSEGTQIVQPPPAEMEWTLTTVTIYIAPFECSYHAVEPAIKVPLEQLDFLSKRKRYISQE